MKRKKIITVSIILIIMITFGTTLAVFFSDVQKNKQKQANFVSTAVSTSTASPTATHTPSSSQTISLKGANFSNSTDCYVLGITCTFLYQYQLDGRNPRKISLRAPDRHSADFLLCHVDDNAIYYYENYDNGCDEMYSDGYEGLTGHLYRLPLHKGSDGRDVPEFENITSVYDTYADSSFTIMDNYYVAMTYHSETVIYNLDTKKKNTNSQNRTHQEIFSVIVEKGKDWILWERKGQLLLQHIPSNKIEILTKISPDSCNVACAQSKNEFLYCYENRKGILSINSYHTQKHINTQLTTEKQIRSCVCHELGIKNNKIEDILVDDIFLEENTIYIQLNLSLKNSDELEPCIIVSQNIEGKNPPAYEKELTQELTLHSDDSYYTKINRNWYIVEQEVWMNPRYYFYCYDRKTKKATLLTSSDPGYDYLMNSYGRWG